jgi:hypothetical protein
VGRSLVPPIPALAVGGMLDGRQAGMALVLCGLAVIVVPGREAPA